MDNKIYFRFDIDTITCIEKGVPALLELAKRLGVRFTFYINMGRSIERREVFLRTPRRTLRNSVGTGSKVSIVRKLGLGDTIRTILLNPRIAECGIGTLQEILSQGHELGLHGGDNHSLWQRRAHEMSKENLWKSLQPAYDRFCELFGAPRGFTCPGTNWSPELYRLIRSLGISYVSDEMPETPKVPYRNKTGLWQLPVNGHICMIPLQEHLRARQYSPEKILSTTFAKLAEIRVRTVYGHPVWEGYRDLRLFEQFVTEALEHGYQFRTYEALLNESLECAKPQPPEKKH